jgi:hypothetical protein
MPKRQPPTQSDVALSPYLSFRQALRPAIFAHSVLLRERDRAGALTEEANRILAVTRELLTKAGLVYITVPESGVPMGTGGGLGSQASLLDAFADAAMLWAKIVGSCLVLAESLLGQGRFEEARSLVAILDDAGEPGSAAELSQRLGPATLAKYRERLGAIHATMTPEEIESALEALIGALNDVPTSRERDEWLNIYVPLLAASTQKYAPNYSAKFYNYSSKFSVAQVGEFSAPYCVREAIFFIITAFRARAQ